METMQGLIEEYKTRPLMSEKEKAELEAQMFVYKREKGSKDTWLAPLLEVASRPIAERASLWALGDAVEPLWLRIDGTEEDRKSRDFGGDMTLTTAVNITRRGKELSHKYKIPMERAVLIALEEYDNFEQTRWLGNGKMVKVPSAAQRRKMNKDPQSLEQPEEIEEEVPSLPAAPVSD